MEMLRILLRIPELIMMVAFVIISFIVLGVMFAFTTFIWVVMWLLGRPINVTENGKKVGYYRWFTFYRK